MRVTIVIPALNEAGNISRLIEESYAAVPVANLAELIVIDDASDDTTPDEIKALIDSGRFPGLRYLRHDRRSGQSTALRTGVWAATSPIIATMDGDGQNDPRDIPRLLELLGQPGSDGVALVGGIRTKRQDTGSKRWASKAANFIRDSVLKDDCPDTGCGIKVYWREAFLRLPFFTSMHRYLPALFQTYGCKVAYLPVNDRHRQAGVSKYNNLNRALVGIYDLVGVSWLRKRTKVPQIVDQHPDGAPSVKPDVRLHDKTTV
ncbi:glycosyltransferase family 2 protein [Hyphomicrobium sulfonivorans]|uniref:glycosyltransferase family 2 protein n=1 Tax=Hyphomicrobium sulfonivorans TaxID=121290 RepID=UPI0015709AC9|nr:glycosyltransferase family 2 protein [Hyphomicrobium sulfonivorans]MBI1649389.1 glycosyltransferase family 2 protein [Hyphomicrobium sulfonivorans]NSL71306.1 glycosyl transferase [Hyphomicrobium sulfonivorans]